MATFCPLYEYGEWNGMHYFYGQLCDDCSNTYAVDDRTHELNNPCGNCAGTGGSPPDPGSSCSDPIINPGPPNGHPGQGGGQGQGGGGSGQAGGPSDQVGGSPDQAGRISSRIVRPHPTARSSIGTGSLSSVILGAGSKNGIKTYASANIFFNDANNRNGFKQTNDPALRLSDEGDVIYSDSLGEPRLIKLGSLTLTLKTGAVAIPPASPPIPLVVTVTFLLAQERNPGDTLPDPDKAPEAELHHFDRGFSRFYHQVRVKRKGRAASRVFHVLLKTPDGEED